MKENEMLINLIIISSSIVFAIIIAIVCILMNDKYKLIAKITYTTTHYKQPTSTGINYSGIISVSHSEGGYYTKNNEKEISAKNLKDLFTQIEFYKNINNVKSFKLEWVQRKENNSWKYIYYEGLEFEEKNKKFLYEYDKFRSEKENKEIENHNRKINNILTQFTNNVEEVNKEE